MSALGTESYCIHKNLVIGLATGLGALLILIVAVICVVVCSRRYGKRDFK